jgi:hypothetical protein
MYEIWSFNATTSVWNLVTTHNFTREGPCASQYNNTQLLWIFGGKNESNPAYENEIYIYDVSAKTIHRLFEADSNGPPAQGVACSVSSDQVFWVFGGRRGNQCSAELWSFSQSKNWTNHNKSLSPGPAEVEGSSAIIYGEEVVIYGGSCLQANFGHFIHRFNTSSGQWSLDTPIHDSQIPPNRKFHTATLISKDRMLIFGGLDMMDNPLGDLWFYDLLKSNWTNVTIAGPSARFSTATGLYFNRFFDYGGNGSAATGALNDTWQLVVQSDCLGLSCEDCTTSTNCGWCNSNMVDYQCVAGTGANSFIASSCSSTTPGSFTSDILDCPEVGFPSWAIALIVIGGVVLIGITVFAIMKIREKPEYQEIR